MMATESALEVKHQPNGTTSDRPASPVNPSTPLEDGTPLEDSQITLPSTEIPPSPIDPNASFKTELNDDRNGATVIPSSLTPPSSAQVHPQHEASRLVFPNSQQSTYYSPPPTVPTVVNGRPSESESGYNPPEPQQILDASAEQLRTMVHACVAEQKRLKMETAHHKLQYTLLSIQATDDSNRAAVEIEMMQRELEALLHADNVRQARRELSTSHESWQAKYTEMKRQLDGALDEIHVLKRRHAAAKKVILQKDDEIQDLMDQRDTFLTRIRENREHMNQLRSPGGLFHEIGMPKQPAMATFHQGRTPSQQTPKSRRRGEEHGLSALLQAMHRDEETNNNSAPSTPQIQRRQLNKHQRNAQSMSSLPTTPRNPPKGEYAGLLPSIDLVPQTEPPNNYNSRSSFMPINRTTPRHEYKRKSRESTISAEDNEELARQALESAAAAAVAASHNLAASQSSARHQTDDDETDMYDSQASQAAREMLRHDARQSFEVRESRQRSSPPADSARTTLSFQPDTNGDKRKFSGLHQAAEVTPSSSAASAAGPDGSPTKKKKLGGATEDERSVGLGIQYRKRY